MSVNYNIYDKLKFSIYNSNNSKINKLRWNFFETDEKVNPDITISLGNFIEKNDECTILSHKYHIKKEYFYCIDQGLKGKWKLEIKNLESRPEISLDYRLNNALTNIFLKEYVAQDFLIPFFEMMLHKKGFFLLHGGAVVRDSQAFIISGRSGSFKTTVLMDLIRRHRFEQLSDDRVVVYRDNIRPFPRSSFFFNYLLNNNKTEYTSSKNNIEIFYKMLFGNDSLNLPSETPIQFTQLYIVSRMNIKDITFKRINRVEAVKKLFLNNFAEYVSSIPSDLLSSFYKYIQIYSLIFPDNAFTNYWKDMEKTLIKILHGVSIYEISLPLKYEPIYTDSIAKFWESINNQ